MKSMPSKKKKYNARFPPARIKKIMQTDDEVGKVAAAVPVLISKCVEMFLVSILEHTGEVTKIKKAKTMSTSHLKECINNEKMFDFLKDIVECIPDMQADEEDASTSVFIGNKDEKKGVRKRSVSVLKGMKKRTKLEIAINESDPQEVTWSTTEGCVSDKEVSTKDEIDSNKTTGGLVSSQSTPPKIYTNMSVGILPDSVKQASTAAAQQQLASSSSGKSFHIPLDDLMSSPPQQPQRQELSASVDGPQTRSESRVDATRTCDAIDLTARSAEYSANAASASKDGRGAAPVVPRGATSMLSFLYGANHPSDVTIPHVARDPTLATAHPDTAPRLPLYYVGYPTGGMPAAVPSAHLPETLIPSSSLSQAPLVVLPPPTYPCMQQRSLLHPSLGPAAPQGDDDDYDA